MESGDRGWIAKVSFYHLLDRSSSRAYLRRNLNHVLDCHERQLFRNNSDASVNEDRIVSTTPQSIARRRIEWDFPRLPESMVRDLIQGQMPTLTISSLSLRVESSQLGAAKRPTRVRGEDPDWLPRPNELRIPCQVTVAVHDLRSTKRQIFLDLRRGTVTKFPAGHGDDVFQIKLADPFRIDKDKLSVVTPSHADKGPWVRELDNNCTLEIGIQFARSDDAAEFLSEIEGRHPEDYVTAPGNEGILRAAWTKLPELPDAGELLPLKRAKGHKSLDLRYGVEVVMGWNQPCSPLVRFHRSLQRGHGEPRQLPTPSSDDLEEPPLPCTVKYLFRQNFQTRSAVTDDLKCLLCPNGGKHSSFERLRLHFLTHHEYLRFEVDESSEENHMLKIVRLSHAEDKQTQEESGFDWEAPETPFDLIAHLGGESMWQTRSALSRQKGATKAAATRSRGRPSKDTPDPPSEQILVKRAKRTILPPEEVEDLPMRKRRKHEVPSVPGIKFYRTTSKQQVLPGTLLSESDEEPEEFWFEQAARSQLMELGVDQISLDFNELFNKHLDQERPMSDALTRDAVVRFARKFTSKLREPRWKDKFHIKLAQFESQRVIGLDTMQYCMQLLSDEDHQATPKAVAVSEGPRREEDIDRTPKQRVDERGPSQSRDRVSSVEKPDRQSKEAERPTSTYSKTAVQVPQQIRSSPFAASSARNGVVPQSSISGPSPKSRIRWKDGRMSSADEHGEHRFGRRKIICTRPDLNDSTGQVAVSEFLKDGMKNSSPGKSEDDIQPSDLAWNRFLRILDHDLVYNRDADNIVCISNNTRIPVVDEHDWTQALAQVQKETTGTIQFELCEMDSVERGYENMAASKAAGVPVSPRSSKGKEPERGSPVPRKLKAHGCICGKPLDGVRGTIACGNPACTREFHMQCVQLQKRSLDWRCVECSS